MRTTTDFWGDRNQAIVHDGLYVPSRPSKTLSGFGKLLQTLFVEMAGTPEPKVWQTTDRSGAVVWNVYDPTTRQSIDFSTEAEVRSWLEQRYYQ